MKGFLVLLCALVAVQGRYTGIEKSSRALAQLGENPWVVHLRIAVSTSGLLNTCEGSLILPNAVLTSASGTTNARFIWVRYGVVNVVSPSLVTENSAVSAHNQFNPNTLENNLAIIITRVVHSEANISPVGLALPGSEVPASGALCVFEAEDNETPGVNLVCGTVQIVQDEGDVFRADADIQTTRFNVGAAVVADNLQVGIVSSPDGVITPTAEYVPWIEEVTGVSLTPESDPEAAVIPEAVHFVDA